jgi:hypothetical protein
VKEEDEKKKFLWKEEQKKVSVNFVRIWRKNLWIKKSELNCKLIKVNYCVEILHKKGKLALVLDEFFTGWPKIASVSVENISTGWSTVTSIIQLNLNSRNLKNVQKMMKKKRFCEKKNFHRCMNVCCTALCVCICVK